MNRPACADWPLPDEPIDYETWQDGRCGFCGQRRDDFPPIMAARVKYVTDHDHATGYVRGLLCHICNTREGASRTAEGWAEWRAGINPCGLLGVVEEYVGWGAALQAYERATVSSWDDLNAAIRLL